MSMESHIREWIAETRDNLRSDRKRAPLYAGYSCYLSFWYGLTSRYPLGTNVYDRDWDVLLVLDACRVDTLREIADGYEFLGEVESIWSVGSQSAEWIANTFTENRLPEIAETTYLAGNGYTESVLSERMFPPRNNTTPFEFSSWNVAETGDFAALEMVWENHHDEQYGVVLPETMTDYAIQVGREQQFDRLIVHYLQPHRPYAGLAYQDGREPTELERRGYESLESGDATREEVYDLYVETLRWVLDDVAVLLENLDAETVAITADHGEAFGEGFVYGHPEGFLHPVVRKVPWVETSATDRGTREPDIHVDEGVTVDVEEHLRDLGYR